jgi:hypothetical protein
MRFALSNSGVYEEIDVWMRGINATPSIFNPEFLL